MSRTLNNIIEDIKFQFKDTVLENAANNKGNLYSLIRGFAISCYNQEQTILDIINTKQLNTTTGVGLDLFAANYNLIRREGTSSFGSVLVRSNIDVVLPTNTLIQTRDGLLTFQTTKSVNISKGKEVSVPIISLSKTFDANLNSGTTLVFPLYSDISVQVGTFRDTNNVVIGSLSGASASESDNNFRTRINTYINNKGLVTLDSIRSRIQNYVSDVYFVEGRPAAGYTTMYINTSDQLTVDLITRELQLIKPFGTLFIIKSIQYQQVDLVVDVIINSGISDSITTISSNIRLAINEFFSNLTVGQTLTVNAL
jgi:uncharacterized phage protein gp47/JayE